MIGAINTLLKSCILIFIVFIPMKTTFYQASFVGLAVIFCFYFFYYRKMEMLKELFLLYRHIIIAFCLILLSMTISNLLGKFVTIDSWSTQFHYLFRYFFVFLILLFFYREKLISKKFIILAILFQT